jgi:hypothetical protein
MNLKIHKLVCFCFIALTLSVGCTTTRSISNSGYDAERGCYRAPNYSDAAFAYHGELSEFDVLAIDRNQPISDADIERALQNGGTPTLKPGSSLLVVQSGAVFPDAPMITALSSNFHVVPFSGVPGATQPTDTGRGAYSRLLRLAAARAGSEAILCYWGILESGTEDLRTKTVSWVPFAGWIVPDERHQMRIRLKLALIDVRTGSWTLFSPPAFGDRSLSTRLSRNGADQRQVESLKKLAYTTSARELTERYAR